MSLVVKGARNRKLSNASTRKASRQRAIAFEQKYTYIPRGVPGEWILPKRTQPLEQNKAVALYNRSSKLSKNSVPDPHRIRDVSAVNRRYYDIIKHGNARDLDEFMHISQLLDDCKSNLQITFEQKFGLEDELKKIKGNLSNTTKRLAEAERNVQVNFGRNTELDTELKTINQKLADTEKELAKMKRQADLRKGLTPSRISQPSIPIMKRFGKKNKDEQVAATRALADRRQKLRDYQNEADPQLRKRNKARDDAFGNGNESYSKSPVAKRIQRMWKTPSLMKAKRDAYRKNKMNLNNGIEWPDESS